MTRLSISLSLFMFGLIGCIATEDPSSISVETVDSAQLRSIAPGVSQGEHAGQQVLYVDSAADTDRLHDDTLREYHALLNEHTGAPDASYVARLTYLQSILQFTSDGSDGPIIITSNFEEPPGEGDTIKCSGGGNSCECRNDCTCIATNQSCQCNCPGSGTL